MDPLKFKKLVEQNKSHKAILDKREGQIFHQLQMQNEKDNPGVSDKNYSAAMAWGNRNAADFLNKALDHKHPENEKTFQVFADKFNCNDGAVKKYFQDEAVKLMNAKPLELRNNGYEASVLNGFKLNTMQDTAYYNKFKDFMKDKWNAVGYTDDDDFVNLFWDCHPLSKADCRPSNRTIETL